MRHLCRNLKIARTSGLVCLGLVLVLPAQAVVQCEQPGNASGINIVDPPADLPIRLEQQVLLPDEYLDFMDYGFDTAISGTWLAVSASLSPSTNKGFVDLYQLNNGAWSKVKTWEGPGKSLGDVFDSTNIRAALADELLVIGDTGALNNNGSAYVFQKDSGGANNWGLLTHLDGNVSNGRFGSSVEIDNETLVVSSREGLTPSDISKGAVYVFEPDQQTTGAWVQSAKPDVLSGYSSQTWLSGIQFSSNRLMGTLNEEHDDSRQAFIWGRDQNAWALSQELDFPDTCKVRGIAIDDNTAVVNLLPVDGIGQEDDSALLFYERVEGGTWQLQFELDTSVYVGDLALRGDRLVAGAIDLDAVAYVFERQSGGAEWQFVEKLMSSDGLESPHSSVSMSGNLLAIRASRFVPEGVGYRTGAVLTYSLQGFAINPGLNDAWYNPQTSGQGFFITVFPDLGAVSLAWFTYDTDLPEEGAQANLGDPGHRWITAVGPFIGNQATMDIELTSGGLFDTPTEIQRTDPPGSDGTIILTFDGCNSGAVEYDIPSINRQGIVPIQRVADDNIALCEALNSN